MIFPDYAIPRPDWCRRLVEHGDEEERVARLLTAAALPAKTREGIQERARALASATREEQARQGGIAAFMAQYDLSTPEGVVLLCLAEALPRIPDAETANALIHDKLAGGHWERFLGQVPSLFANASTLGLMLAGRLLGGEGGPGPVWRNLVRRSSATVIREALIQAVRLMGGRFVYAATLEQALERARRERRPGDRFSFDMLGETARTRRQAERYFESYRLAIAALGRVPQPANPLEADGISVKLSALHPRFEPAKRERVLLELGERLRLLAREAREAGITLTIDAEEASRLELTLELVERVSLDGALQGWCGFGVAVQSYQKRALEVVDVLAAIARQGGRTLPVRLVKGAYWDSEIKAAQEQGLPDYPVFTRKTATDVSYQACAKALFAAGELFHPQFATHNAQSVAMAAELGRGLPHEFQRLHGMGEGLYRRVRETLQRPELPVRIYAPVGQHAELLSYLVRRLLENGANSSFVNLLEHGEAPVEELIADPVTHLHALAGQFRHPRIPPPPQLYAPERRNALGLDLANPEGLVPLALEMAKAGRQLWLAGPLVGGVARLDGETAEAVCSPATRERVVGRVTRATPEDVDRAMALAHAAAPAWDRTPPGERAACLERAAALLEGDRAVLMALCVLEGGKTIADALAEVREAVDFCRYYAAQARRLFAAPQLLPGPTGERNELQLHGRGVFACIAPFNFPLAIFTGQVAAALGAGNAVIAKPARQTPLIAARVTAILHEAGIPGDVLHLLPGRSEEVAGPLLQDPRLAGVCLTGSVDAARRVNQALAQREGPILPFIAETGGLNAMIVDSSVLLESVVRDVVVSAFSSAGQRCSALRMLYVQEEIADRFTEMLTGAMDELRVGDPSRMDTDVGPIIDAAALEALRRHGETMGTPLHQAELTPECGNGWFHPPTLYRVSGIEALQQEVFGPVLHLARFKAGELENVVAAVNATGYGLTCGIQTRIDERARHLQTELRAGNCYVNRTMIGAMVGVQPFGGEGLSGTGPKAGGPHYLLRFATERTLTINLTATGGNPELLSLSGEES